MTTAISYSNPKSLFKNLLINEIKKYSIASILLFVGLFFSDVVSTANINKTAMISKAEPPYGSNSSGMLVTVVFFILLLSTFLFRYLHNRRATDFYHSLPISRKDLLLIKFITGTIICIVPLLMSGILRMISYPVYGFSVPWGVILFEIINQIIFVFAAWSIASLIAVNTSTSIEMFGYTGASWLVGLILPAIWVSFSQTFIYGYKSEGIIGIILSPCVLLVNSIYNPSYFTIILWIILTITALYMAILSYKKRNSEYAEQWGRDTILSRLVKVFAGILGAFVFSSILISYMNDSKLGLIYGILIGIPFAYFIIEIITAKGIRTIKRSLPRAMILTASVFVLSTVFIYTGGFGYEKVVPKVSDIKSVEIFDHGRNIYESPNESDGYKNLMYKYSKKLTSPEAIEKVINVQKKLIENKDYHERMQSSPYALNDSFEFIYNTKFGKQHRYYYVYPEQLNDIMKIRQEPEFIEQNNPLFYIHPIHVTGVSIGDGLNKQREVYNLDADKLSQLLEAARADALDPQKYMDTINNKDLGVIEFMLQNLKDVFDAKIEPLLLADECIFNLRESDTRTLALLKSWDMEAPAVNIDSISQIDIMLTPDIIDFSEVDRLRSMQYNADNLFFTTSVTDKAIIEKIMESASSYHPIDQTMTEIHVLRESESMKGLMEYNSLFINNETLIEIMAGREEKVSYLFTLEEYKSCLNGNLRPMETIDNNIQNIMDVPGKTVGEYFQENFPEFLEGRSDAVIAAMYYTPFITDDGHHIIYSGYPRFAKNYVYNDKYRS